MKRTKRTLVMVVAVLLILSIAVGCSAKQKMSAGEGATAPRAPVTNSTAVGRGNEQIQVKWSEETNADYAKVEADGIRGTGYDTPSSTANTSGTNAALDILAERKVIRNANLSIEVDNFYNSYGNLQAMLNGIGYVSDSNIHREFYTVEEERITRVFGDITLRVDARHFDNILNDLKGLGEVIDDRIYSSDVTDQFYDTEGRLKILKIEYDYLEEYMKSLNDPDSIFKTRMRMTELQTEIERLTGTLNKLSNLVELSTIYIQMNEKYPEQMAKKATHTYWDRLKDSISNSLTGIVDALGDLLIFIIEAIPTLVILAIIGFVGYRVVIKNIKKRKTPISEVKNE